MCWEESKVMVRQVPFKIGKTPSGLWWGVGEAPMASGGRATVIAEQQGSEHPVEDCAAKMELYRKLQQIVRDLENLARAINAHRRATEATHVGHLAGGLATIGGRIIPSPPTSIANVYPGQTARYFETPNRVDIRPGRSELKFVLAPPLGRNTPVVGIPTDLTGYQIMGTPWGVGLGWPDWANPTKWPGAIEDAVKVLGKPLTYAAGVMTGGVPGLAAIWIGDQVGAFDALGKLLTAAGGILLSILASPFFQGACTAVSHLISIPEMGMACLLASVGAEVASAVSNKDWNALAQALQKVAAFASQYFDPVDALKGVLEGAFQAIQAFGAWDVIDDFFGPGLDAVDAALQGALPPAQYASVHKMIQDIRAKKDDILRTMGHAIQQQLIQAGLPFEVGAVPWAMGAVPLTNIRQIGSNKSKTTDPKTVPHGPVPSVSKTPILSGIVSPTRPLQRGILDMSHEDFNKQLQNMTPAQADQTARQVAQAPRSANPTVPAMQHKNRAQYYYAMLRAAEASKQLTGNGGYYRTADDVTQTAGIGPASNLNGDPKWTANLRSDDEIKMFNVSQISYNKQFGAKVPLWPTAD